MADASSSVWLPVLPDMSGFGPAVIKGAGKEADKSGKTVGQRFGTAINVGVAAIATGAVAAGTALYKIGESFDEARDLIRAGTGATGKDLDALVENTKNVARQVPFEIETIGGALADVNTRLGLTGETLETFAIQMLEAGRLMGEDLDINTLSDAFNVFRLEGEETTEAMDHLFRVSQATGVGINELAANAANAAPAAKELGFSFEETTALVGNLDKAGLNSSRMMNGLSRSLVELAKDGEEPKEAFERVTGEMQAFIDKGDKAAALNLASDLFGTRNAPAFIDALESGAIAMEDLGHVAGMTDDTIIGAGQETMDFAEHWQMFKNDIITQLEPAATKLFDAISEGMKWVRENGIPILKDFGTWLKDNEGWLKGVAIAVGGIVAVWKTYQITMKLAAAAQGAWNVITTVGQGIVKAFTVAQRALNVVLKANPIGLVVTAIGLLVAAFVTAYNKSETFRKIVDAAWNGIKAAAEAVWNFLKKWVFAPIIAYYKLLWTAAMKAKDFIVGAWDTMKAGLQAGWDWVKRKVFDRFTDGVAVLRSKFSDAVERIKNIWDGIKAAFQKPWDWVKTNVIDRFKDGISNLRDHVSRMKDAIGDAWKGIANKFRNPINWVLDKVWNNGIAKAFNSAAGALNLKLRLSTEAQIPAFAKGGLAKRGWALVGEEGPELVNFSNPGRVYTAAETAEALSLTGAPNAIKHTDSLPMGGGLGSRMWEGVKSAAGAVTGWVRGGLAKAADLILSPIRKIIAPTVAQWGTFGKFAGGTITNSIDSLVEWIRGKDDVGEAGSIQADISGGKWSRPSRGRVTSRYGPRSLMGMNFHAGIDYAGGPFTYAAAAGKVFKTGWNILSGRSGIGIGIDHGGGVFTYYGHNPSLGAIKVRPGDMVRAGQHIGQEGATGNVTGPHLHFETHRGGWGRHVNPSSFGIFDGGGWLEPGMAAYHSSRMSKPDAVLTARQWDDIHRLAAGGGGGDTYNVSLEVDIDEVGDVQRLVHTFRELPRRARQKAGVR